MKEKLKRFFGGANDKGSSPRVYEDAPRIGRTNIPGSIMRQGMWVETPRGVGILYSFGDASTAKVHLTNGDGVTVEIITVPLSEVAVAPLAKIPPKRIGHLTPEQARRFGYI